MPQSSVDMVVANNLKDVLEASGKSAYAVAKALGHAPNWLYRVINGEAGILLPTLREVAAELDVSVGTLVDPPGQDGLEDARMISLEEVKATPGSGASRYDETPRRRLNIPKDMLGDSVDGSSICQLVRIQGDSMAPTLPDGCMVIVDRLSQKLENEGVYVMETDEGLLVKRVRQEEGLGWVVLSGERDPVRVPMVGNFRIIGRVLRVWADV